MTREPHAGSMARCRIARSGPGIVVLAVLCLAACTTPPAGVDEHSRFIPDSELPIPPSLEPIVMPFAPGTPGGEGAVRDDSPVDASDAGWAEKYRLTLGYATGGFDEAARELVHATLSADPPSPWRERFEVLRGTLRVGRIRHDLLRVDARGDRDYARFGAEIDWRVRLRNVSTSTLYFGTPSEASASPTALSLRIVRRDVDVYGTELQRIWNQTVYLQRQDGPELAIPPGGIHEATVRVPSEDVGAAIPGIRILELTGTLRGMVRIETAGDEDAPREESIGLPVRPGRVIVLPEGYEPLAADPLGSMATAVDTVAPTHLLVATEFVGRARSRQAIEILARALASGDGRLANAAYSSLGIIRERAVGDLAAPLAAPLIEILQTHPTRSESIIEGLVRLTGQTLAPDARLWTDWWRRAQHAEVRVPPKPNDAAMEGTR